MNQSPSPVNRPTPGSRRLLKRLVGVVAVAAVFFVAAGLLQMMAYDIIIWFGLPLLNILFVGALSAGLVALLGGATFVAARSLSDARQAKRLAALSARPERAVQAPHEFKPGDETAPEKVRAFLIAETQGKPLLAAYRDRCLDIMDAIDSKQDKLDAILKRAGRDEQLRIAVDALQSAEDTVCVNIAKIANRATIWDAKDAQDAKKQAVYATYRQRIEGYLDKNDEIMNGIDNLLDQVMLFIDNKDGIGKGSVDLDVTICTLKNLTANEHY
ncbi:MAG: hypothetical protein LBU07_07375 [Coriobacteriales bacterium]|jgi:hypothetical protein|nr:hypothetical protein [Coriobacteriales bacterium]